MAMSADLHVCTGCRDRDRERRKAGLGGGPALLAAIRLEIGRRLPAAGIDVVGHDCLGACPRRGRASIAGSGRWSWLFAGLDAETDVPALCDFVGRWLAAQDGLVAKADRGATLRSKILGRVPPLRFAGPATQAGPSPRPHEERKT
jgi:predicted metal-binding protein